MLASKARRADEFITVPGGPDRDESEEATMCNRAGDNWSSEFLALRLWPWQPDPVDEAHDQSALALRLRRGGRSCRFRLDGGL